MSPILQSRCRFWRRRWNPTEASTWTTWLVEDQRAVGTRTDVLSYQTPVLEKAVRLEGAPFADLFVKTTGTDADFVVKIIDVYPPTYAEQPDLAGYELAISLDIFRGRYRKSFTTPGGDSVGRGRGVPI